LIALVTWAMSVKTPVIRDAIRKLLEVKIDTRLGDAIDSRGGH